MDIFFNFSEINLVIFFIFENLKISQSAYLPVLDIYFSFFNNAVFQSIIFSNTISFDTLKSTDFILFVFFVRRINSSFYLFIQCRSALPDNVCVKFFEKSEEKNGGGIPRR